jgi:hypothetical protein
MELRDRIKQELVSYGLAEFGELHAWRCRYPDIYGPCTCLDELTDDLVKAVEKWVEE